VYVIWDAISSSMCCTSGMYTRLADVPLHHKRRPHRLLYRLCRALHRRPCSVTPAPSLHLRLVTQSESVRSIAAWLLGGRIQTRSIVAWRLSAIQLSRHDYCQHDMRCGIVWHQGRMIVGSVSSSSSSRRRRWWWW
jgi:hypothetical protein